MRADLFTTVHKGLRAILFELSVEVARVDLADPAAVDALLARLGRVCAFLDEHARHEDAHVLPALREVAAATATSLDLEHRMLETIQTELVGVAGALARTPTPEHGAQLLRVVNRLVAAQLAHMGREETDANHALWRAYSDAELGAIRERLIGAIPPARRGEWRAILAPVLNPVERALFEATVG